MAFTWSQISSGSPIENEDFNEIKTNLDTIYTALGISRAGCSGAGWSADWPIPNGGAIRSSHIQELRAVADYADDRACSANNTSNYTGDYSAQNSAANSTDNSGVNGTDNTTVKSTNYTTDNGTHDSGVNGVDNTTVRSSNYSGNWSSYNSTNKTSEYTGVKTADYGSDNSSYDSHCGAHHLSYCDPLG